MIRRALPSDWDTVIRIWLACFPGDDAGYVRFFLENCFSLDRCLLDIRGGDAAAMLHLLPMTMHAGGESLRGQCLYAAGTLPEYRRKGVMRELIESAVLDGGELGCYFTVLKPAREKLFEFYQRSGFTALETVWAIDLTRPEMEAAANGSLPINEVAQSFSKLSTMRKERFQSSVLWDDEMSQYIFREWQRTGGQITTAEDGYALVREEDGYLLIKEICALRNSFRNLLAALLKRYSEKKFRLVLAPGAQGLPHALPVRSAMIRVHKELPAPFANIVFSGGVYMNMMLD